MHVIKIISQVLRDKRVEETRELLARTLVPASQDKVPHLAYIASCPIQANAKPDPNNGARAIKDVPENSPTMVEDTYQDNGAKSSQSSQRVPESQVENFIPGSLVQMSVPDSQGVLESSQKNKRSSQKDKISSQKQSSQNSSQRKLIKDDDWKLSSQFDHTKPSNIDLSTGDDTLEDFPSPQDKTVLETKPDKFKSPKSRSVVKKSEIKLQSPLVKYSPLKFSFTEVKSERSSEPIKSNAEMKLLEKMSKQFAAKKETQELEVGTIKIKNKASESSDNVIDLSKSRVGVTPADLPLSSPEDLVLLEDKSGEKQDCASPNVKDCIPSEVIPSSPGGVYQQILDKPEKKLGFKRKLMDLDETFLNTQTCSQGSSQGSQDSALGRRNKRKTPAFAKRKSGNPVKTESFVLSTKGKGKKEQRALPGLPNIKDLDELVPIVPRRGSILKKKFFDKPGAISSPAIRSFNFDPDSPEGLPKL